MDVFRFPRMLRKRQSTIEKVIKIMEKNAMEIIWKQKIKNYTKEKPQSEVWFHNKECYLECYGDSILRALLGVLRTELPECSSEW